LVFRWCFVKVKSCCSAEDFVLTTLIKIHEDIAPVILAAGGITLIWGITVLVLARRRTSGSGEGSWGPLRTFRVLLTITAALGLIQALLGGLMYLQGARPGDGLHYVYGGIVLLAIPVAYVYSDQQQVRRDIIIMVIAVVAVVGAAVRALMTGAPH
jgi:hypothetical protein